MRLAVMELVHLWNQRNGYQTQMQQLQKHLEVNDQRIQEARCLSPSISLLAVFSWRLVDVEARVHVAVDEPHWLSRLVACWCASFSHCDSVR